MGFGRLLSGLSMLFSRAKYVVLSMTFSCVFFFFYGTMKSVLQFPRNCCKYSSVGYIPRQLQTSTCATFNLTQMRFCNQR